MKFMNTKFVIEILEPERLTDGTLKVEVRVEYTRIADYQTSSRPFWATADSDYEARNKALVDALEWIKGLA